METNLKQRKGFTLIEMTIVLFIISLLILIIIPNISRARKSAQETHRKAMVSLVKTQVSDYLDEHSNTTGNVTYEQLINGGYLTVGQKQKAKDEEHIQIKTDEHGNNNVVE